jgi:hypothetical protein
VRIVAVLALIAVAFVVFAPGPRRTVRILPPGVTELHSEMVVDTDLEGNPAGSILRMAADFQGRAAIVVRGNGVRLRDFDIEGNRPTREVRTGLPPYDVPFARFTTGNGILIDGATGVAIDRVHFREIAGFAVLAHAARRVAIANIRVRDSGSRDANGKNNTTGGVLLEHGTADFRVTDSEFRNIRGNGLWTHSLYTAPRNARGLFANNTFEMIGRDALQAGHAVDIRIERNSGRGIGFPRDIVDATPVAIDTAGNVERSAYVSNRFEVINGKCIDLDGFHDGEVSWNQCSSVFGYGLVMNNTNPDMQSRGIRIIGNSFFETKYGGIFVIGTGHRIAQNRLVNVNSEHCDDCIFLAGEPEMLRSGIYLGKRAERPDPAHGNVVEDNEITGYKMAERCVQSAPGITNNVIRNNVCRDLP